MEEDIKKCEALLGSERWVLGTQDKKALENLIKGYRELKEENSGLKLDRRNLSNCIEAIKHTTPLNMVSNTDYYIQINDNFIPKSKIKEKIEELNNYDSEFCQRVIDHNEHTLTEFVQNILQELMEE